MSIFIIKLLFEYPALYWLVSLFDHFYFLLHFFRLVQIVKLFLCFFEMEYISQSAFTCSKLTIETLEQGVKVIQSYSKFTIKTPLFYSIVSIVNFEHVIAGWDIINMEKITSLHSRKLLFLMINPFINLPWAQRLRKYENDNTRAMFILCKKIFTLNNIL